MFLLFIYLNSTNGIKQTGIKEVKLNFKSYTYLMKFQHQMLLINIKTFERLK